jgi:hypothetical protein
MKRKAIRHWKTKALKRSLNVPLSQAIGILELLWIYTADYTPCGDIGKVCNEDIAEACDWPEDRADELINALLGAGFVDEHESFRLVIHHWYEHAPDNVHMQVGRARQYFTNGQRPRLGRIGLKERQEIEADYERMEGQSHDSHTAPAQGTHGKHTTETEAEAAPSPTAPESVDEAQPSNRQPEPPSDGAANRLGFHRSTKAETEYSVCTSSVSDSEESTSGSVSATGSKSTDTARNKARLRWMHEICRLFAPSGSQRQSDHTSAEQLFDEYIWPESIDPAQGKQRFDQAREWLNVADRRDNPMAWLTKRIKSNWRQNLDSASTDRLADCLGQKLSA